MKIYAKQTPPEWQQSPLYCDEDFPENVEVFGNNRLTAHTSQQFNNIPSLLEDLADEIDDLRAGRKRYTDLGVILEAYTGKHDYTRQERKKWLEVIKRWTETDEEATVFRDVLALLRGKPHKLVTLRGSCQGDWQYCIYPADEYGAEWVNSFEAEYFNTGTEWSIYENGLDGECYGAYDTKNSPREFIAEITGADPADIILLEFDGWTHTPKYRRSEA